MLKCGTIKCITYSRKAHGDVKHFFFLFFFSSQPIRSQDNARAIFIHISTESVTAGTSLTSVCTALRYELTGLKEK